jgi:FkbM family methyltransferase
MSVSKGNKGHSTVGTLAPGAKWGDAERTVQVETRRLDQEFAGLDEVGLVKIDVEGFECR